MGRSIAENPAGGNPDAGAIPAILLHSAGRLRRLPDEGVPVAQKQDFENHAKFVPAFHFVALPILLLNLGWSIYRIAHAFSANAAIQFLVAIALILIALNARIFALRVQDRVIRLEMQLRLQQVLPADLHPRIGDFELGQLVSLRFASNAELPVLARKVLEENLTDRKAIKKLIRNWQADLLRA
jgi:Family of unknown function (DUF6526)